MNRPIRPLTEQNRDRVVTDELDPLADDILDAIVELRTSNRAVVSSQAICQRSGLTPEVLSIIAADMIAHLPPLIEAAPGGYSITPLGANHRRRPGNT